MKEFNIKFYSLDAQHTIKGKKIKHKLIPCHFLNTNSYFCKGIYSYIYYHLYRDDYIESNIIRRA